MTEPALLALGAIAAVVLVVSALDSPFRLLAFYGLIVPFASEFAVPIGVRPPFNTLSTIVGAAVAAVFMVHLLAGEDPLRRPSPAVPAFLGFLAVSGLTFLWSVDRATTASELLILFSLIATYAVVTMVPARPPDVRLVENGIIWGGVLTSLYGLVLWSTAGLELSGAGFPRFATAGGGGGGNAGANITAATLLLPLAVAAGRTVWASSRRERLLTGASVVAIGGGLVLTASRGGMLSMAVIAMVLALNSGRRLAAVAAPVLLLGVLVVVAPSYVSERIGDTDSTGRTEIWRIGISACPQHCLVGSGWGTFSDVHEERYLTDPAASGRSLRFVAHNIWIQTAVELGVAGVLLLAAGMGVLATQLLRLPASVRAAPLATLVALLGANMFLSNLDFKYFWLALIYVSLTVTAHAGTQPGDPRRHEPMGAAV